MFSLPYWVQPCLSSISPAPFVESSAPLLLLRLLLPSTTIATARHTDRWLTTGLISLALRHACATALYCFTDNRNRSCGYQCSALGPVPPDFPVLLLADHVRIPFRIVAVPETYPESQHLVHIGKLRPGGQVSALNTIRTTSHLTRRLWACRSTGRSK